MKIQCRIWYNVYKSKWITIRRRKIPNSPMGAFFCALYGISIVIFGVFIGLFMLERVPPMGSPILGIILIILWVLSGMLGVVAAIVYRDDRSPNPKSVPSSIMWQQP